MPDILGMYAQSQPDKPGVIDDKPDGTVVTWTYAELDAQANRLGNLLLSLGLSPGKKVLWCGPNSPEVVAIMSAARKIGAVAVPLNYRLTPEEALYVINHSDAEVAYVDYEHAPMFAALRAAWRRSGTSSRSAARPRPGCWPTPTSRPRRPMRPTSETRRARRDDDLHLRHDRQAQGAVRSGARIRKLLGALLNLFAPADDLYITSGPLYHSGPARSWARQALGQTIVVQRKFDAEDWLRSSIGTP